MLGDPPVRLVVVPGQVFRIGRDTEADLCLDDRLVSRRHCDLTVTESGALEAKDYGSRNGTKVNGRALQGTVALVPGDEVRIGAAVLVVDGVHKAEAPLPSRPRAFVRPSAPATAPAPTAQPSERGTAKAGRAPATAAARPQQSTNDELAIPTFSEEPGPHPPPPPLGIVPAASRDRERGGGTSQPIRAAAFAPPSGYLAPGDTRSQVPGYELLSQVARGRTGVIWRARMVGPGGAERLLKVLDPGAASRENALERFEAEAGIIASIDHPNLARVLDVSSANGLHYYAMEAVEGQPLEEHLKEGVLEPRDAIVIAAQVARGLAAAHAKGVIHRDVAPASVIVTPELVVKLFDFCFVKVSEDMPSLTEIGDVVGDLRYCAPEQASQPRSIDHRADLYAIGATIYHAIAGIPPIEGKNYLDTYRRIISDPPRPIQELVPDVRPKLAQVMARLLEKEPAKRYANATEVAAALAEACLDAVITARTFVPAPGTGIGADFRGVELLEILQVLASRRATGHLSVASTSGDGVEGEVVLRAGEVVAARTLDSSDLREAANQLLDVRQGTFTFRSDPNVQDQGEAPLHAADLALDALRRRK